ncbi:MAG: hypothetical protein RLO12_10485 [Fulvivirga sp.]
MPKLKLLYQSAVNQLFIYFILLILTAFIYGCNNQSVQDEAIEEGNELLTKVVIRRSAVDFTLVLESDSMSRSLAFYKNEDSTTYRHMN